MAFNGEEYIGDEHEERDRSGDNKAAIAIMIVLLFIAFIPAALIAFLDYMIMFRKCHWRLSVSALVTAFSGFVIAILMFIIKPFSSLALFSIQEISSTWTHLILPYVFICIPLGMLIGFLFIMFNILQLKAHPELRKMKGWAYEFTFAKTPWAKAKRKKYIADIKSGKLNSNKRAPLGVNDGPILTGAPIEGEPKYPEAPVFRYYSEATSHSLITGGTGSGKALEKNTKIPTPTGFRTVEELDVGDIIFDEKGKHTKILNKFQPMTPDHYEITFNCGTKVRACGDHLWQVIKLTDKNKPEVVVNTRDLYNKNKQARFHKKLFAIRASEYVNYPEQDLPYVPQNLGFWIGDAFGAHQVWKKVMPEVSEIPDAHLFSSYTQRIAFIKAIMAEAGSYFGSGGCVLELTDVKLLTKVHHMIKSMGWIANKIYPVTNYKYMNDFRMCAESFSFVFYPDVQVFPEKTLNNFWLNRKMKCQRNKIYITDIRLINDKPENYYCFTVDSPSHLFLCTESYIPTHNTVTMLSLIQNDIVSGKPVCVVDFKAAPVVTYFLSKWAKENGRKFYHFTSGKPGTYRNPYCKEQATYDPLAEGTSSSKADMMLNLRTWDSASEVFKKRTQDILQSVFYLLENTDPNTVPDIAWGKGGLLEFSSALKPDNLKAMIEEMSIRQRDKVVSDVEKYRLKSFVQLYEAISAKGNSGLRDQIDELASNCRILTNSSYGNWLAYGQSSNHINLLDIAMDENNEAPVVLFSFSETAEPDCAKFMGGIIMSDLARVSAIKGAKANETYFGLYVDETQALDPGSVRTMLEKARSANFFLTLTYQSLEQIIASAAMNGEAILNAIIDTCANFIFHAGAKDDSGERMSAIIGKRPTIVYSVNSQMNSRLLSFNWGNSRKALVSKRTDEGWTIPPYEFQNLSKPEAKNGYKAQAYVVNKSCSDPRFNLDAAVLARKTHIIASDEIAQGMPEKFVKYINQQPEIEEKPIEQPIDLGNWEIEEIADNEDENSEEIISIFEPEKPKLTSFQAIKNQKKEEKQNKKESESLMLIDETEDIFEESPQKENKKSKFTLPEL